MARIRTIKPAIWQSEQLGSCHPLARLLFIGLISHADDEGRMRGAAALIRSLVFPYDEQISTASVDGWLGELAAAGLIVRYAVDDASYIALPAWESHQKIDRRASSTLPPPPEDSSSPRRILDEPSASDRGGLAEDSLPEKEEEGKRKTTTRARTADHAPPTPAGDDVAAIVAPLGRKLTPHQHARAVRVHAEHGADVLRHLVDQANSHGIAKPIAAFVGFLAPESDALVEAVDACRAERAAAAERAAYIADLEHRRSLTPHLGDAYRIEREQRLARAVEAAAQARAATNGAAT